MSGSTVLVTGATGALGQVLIRELQQRPGVDKIIALARSESRLAETLARFNAPGKTPVIDALADVRDLSRLERINYLHKPDKVIHAAALKRVEVGEREPMEIFLTNVAGTFNVCTAFSDSQIMLISSDKAVAPCNSYGFSKASAERIVLSMGGSVSRYGNVVASTGSVIPIWEMQKRFKLTPTVTDPNMTRFWWPLDAAAKYVLARMDEARGGEIFVPRLKAASVLDLYHALHGEDAPYELIPVRPGEKLHEQLKLDNEPNVVALPGIYSSDKAPRLKAEEIRRMCE